MRPDLVSGGFYITRAIARPGWPGDDLLPERILTLSKCLTELVPDWWAWDWSSAWLALRLAVFVRCASGAGGSQRAFV